MGRAEHRKHCSTHERWFEIYKCSDHLFYSLFWTILQFYCIAGMCAKIVVFDIKNFSVFYASSSFYLAFWTVKFYLWAFFLYLFIFVALQQKIKSRFIFYAGSSFVIGNYNGLWLIFHIKLTEVSYFFSMIFVVNWIEQKNWELSKFFDFPKML